jgi:hypothetical protein
MHLQLAASGTVSECREALNAQIAKLEPTETEKNAIVRAIAHYIVNENLDPLYRPWVDQCNACAEVRAKGTKLEDPPEPTTSFSIDCTIVVQELARQQG